MKAVMLAADAIKAGSASVVVAGGMESMTNAPYLLKKARGGYRLGHDKVYDHMMLDGLEDAYEEGRSMGLFGEDCAAKYNFTRQMQDDFAMASVQRAQQAIASGAFKEEITPVTIKDRKGERVVDTDEGPGRIKPEKIPTLKLLFILIILLKSMFSLPSATIICSSQMSRRLNPFFALILLFI